MFLKKIEMQGFKSFADTVEINFDQPITAIVGPNGCGKSNVIDAIRWVLGEQSVKNMRGDSMSDVIFAGSSQRKAVNMAMVSLTFDNKEGLLDPSYSEIEVTRKLYRSSGEGEYYINKKPVRLKDVVELTLDLGLGKDSLSMISQGTISHYADAKPLDRRALFEDAAGVSKYKKRKLEALAKLNRTADNIDRLMDILSELEGQLKPLAKAKDKALAYQDLAGQLKSIEVSVLALEAKESSDLLDQVRKRITDLEADRLLLETHLRQIEEDLEGKKIGVRALDERIDQSQEKILEVMNRINRLESRRIEFEEKSKYRLRVGDEGERQKEMLTLLTQAKAEFDDRVQRAETLKAHLDLVNQTSMELNRNLVDQQVLVGQEEARLNRLTLERNNQKQLLERPYFLNQGVTTILDHKTNLLGIYDVVANLLSVHEGYELALTTSLGSSQNNIATSDQEAAKRGIEFLKANRSGRATFSPLSVIKPRSLNPQSLLIAQNTEGFCGLASDFVDCDPEFDDLKMNLLGNVCVCDSIDSAKTLSNRLNNQVKVVSLDGDLFHIGGNMTGGRSKTNNSLLLVQKEMSRLDAEINQQTDRLEKAKGALSNLQDKKNEVSQELMNLRLNLAQIEPIIEVKRAKLDKLKNESELLKVDLDDQQEGQDLDLIKDLNQAFAERDRLTIDVASYRRQRMDLNNELEKMEIKAKEGRKDLQALIMEENNLKVTQGKNEAVLETALDRLSADYQMTYQFALSQAKEIDLSSSKELVQRLRSKIESLGTINMSAPSDYDDLLTRTKDLQDKLTDLQESRQNLLDFIDQMDDLMKKDLRQAIEDINREFDHVFKELFGGGHAKLILDQPDDILNTGIDIDVAPNGKTIQNIRLFSGGEKALIAISLLFAILRVKKVPLCIFDEIEAALDQANVARLADYLGKYRKDTQFILISHRPGTMAKADILYGVTMAQKGVSSLLRVKFKEANDLLEKGSV